MSSHGVLSCLSAQPGTLQAPSATAAVPPPSFPLYAPAGEYSNFWSDPEQFKGIVIFSAVLASFFSLGNIGAALLLPWLYNKPIELCFQALVLGYPCAGQ